MATEKEIMDAGRKALAQKEKDKAKSKVTALAVKKLIANHQDEYDGYLG